MKGRIIIDRKIRHGKPIIRGTRVGVDIVLGSLAAGMAYEEICKEYGIKREDILAVMSYANSVISTEEIHAVKLPLGA